MAAEAEFKVPGELEELELPRKDRYCVPADGADLRDASSTALHDTLDGALAQLVDGEPDALAEAPGCFDCLYSFVRDFKYVPSDIKGRVLDVLQHTVGSLVHELGGGLQNGSKRSRGVLGAGRQADAAGGEIVQGQAPSGLRNSFKMAVFLLFSAAWRAESAYSSARQNELLQPKVKAVGTAAARKKAAAAAAKEDGKFVWETVREDVLGTMALALTVDLQRLWNLGVSDEAFASLFPRLAYKMLEVPATLRAKAARASALALIAVPYHAVSALAAPVGAAVLQLISDHEHLTGPMAELCVLLAAEYSDTRLAAELLREIGRMNVAEAARNAAGLRNTAAFMTEVCTLLPGVAHASVAVLLPHLGSEPYTLRSAVATCLAAVVGAACEEDLRQRRLAASGGGDAGTEEEAEACRERGRWVQMEPHARDSLLDVLEDRVRDSSSYTRAAVLRAWCGLCERGALPHARVLAAAKLGAARLRDKSALVRRAAVQLLGALLERNPYAGSLDPAPYVERAATLEEQLAALPLPPLLTAEEAAALQELECDGSADAAAAAASADAGADAGSSSEQSGNDEEEQVSGCDSEGEANSSGTAKKRSRKQQRAADGAAEPVAGAAVAAQQAEQEEGELSPEAAARATVLRELTYCRGALAFIEVYEGSSDATAAAAALAVAPQLCSMLQSRSVSDVTEALRFFVKARAFSLPCASAGVRRSLALIWHAEPSVREEVTKAFVEVFIAPAASTAAAAAAASGAAEDDADEEQEQEEQSPAAALRVAHNLVVLVAQSSLAELASLEEVVGGLVKSGALAPAVFEQLWTAAGAKEQAGWARAAALQALALGAGSMPALAEDAERLELIATTALGTTTQESRDWPTVKAACALLQRCPLSHGGDRAAALEASSRRLVQFLQGDWCRDAPAGASAAAAAAAESDMQHWFGAAEAALGVLFKHCAAPEELCAGVVRRMAATALAVDATAADSSSGSSNGAASPLALARLCFVLGHAALKLLVYSEDLASRLKKAKGGGAQQQQRELAAAAAVQEAATAAAAAAVEATAGKKGTGRKKKAAKSSGADSGDDETDALAAAVATLSVDDTMEEELGTTAEEEAEDEKRFSELAEREIVGRNLLGVFGPLLARIVANEGGAFSHPLLRESAVLALSKYMCISGEVCSRHLNLLFTALAAAPETAVRANIVVALGDLAFRFPNAVEPWNALIYARLRDPSPRVRANTLMVLTHLILNDMVKVKGLVSDIALCLRDPLPRLRDMAKLFFNELAKRGDNPIYNLLPDIVGRLSQAEDVPPAAFREVMGFLLGFIKKEKQIDGLLDKLCARVIAASDSPQQRRDMAYCLGQLQVTEKGIKRLTETIATYKDALGDEDVYSHFMTLVSRARKFAKPEMRAAVDEWEKQLVELHAGGADNEGAATRAVKASKRAKRGGRSVPALTSVDEEELSDAAGESAATAKTPARSTAARGARAKAAASKSTAKPSTSKKPSAAAKAKAAPARKSGRRAAAAADSSEEEEREFGESEGSGGSDSDSSGAGDDDAVFAHSTSRRGAAGSAASAKRRGAAATNKENSAAAAASKGSSSTRATGSTRSSRKTLIDAN